MKPLTWTALTLVIRETAATAERARYREKKINVSDKRFMVQDSQQRRRINSIGQ